MQWLRLYIEILDDPKMSNSVLDPATFQVFILLLLYACELEKNGEIDQPIDIISWRLRIPIETLRNAIETLLKQDILENKEILKVKHWKKRQYSNDCSTDRVKRFRNKMKRCSNVSETLHETPPETEYRDRDRDRSEAETEKEPPLTPQGGNEVSFPFLNNPDFKKSFCDFEEMRIQMRKKLTPISKTRMLKLLHKNSINTAIAMVEQSISQQWQGIFPVNSLQKKGKINEPEEHSDLEYLVVNRKTSETGNKSM